MGPSEQVTVRRANRGSKNIPRVYSVLQEAVSTHPAMILLDQREYPEKGYAEFVDNSLPVPDPVFQ